VRVVTVVLLVLTLVFFGVFLVGFVWNGVTNVRKGRRARDPEEFGPSMGSAPSVSRRWFRGRSAGFSWSDEMSFGELRRGVASGEWRGSVRLQQFVLLVSGFLLGVCSLTLLIGWLIGPAAFVIAIGLVLYIAFQMYRGMKRAP
jgi:hypothetical protein